MGMFDKPQYLTGDTGMFTAGETFWLHNARIEGTSNINGEVRPQAKLLVSRERDGEKTVVFTSGRGITGQIQRMNSGDRSGLPMEVRLDAIPAKQSGRNPTHVLTPADQPEPSAASDDFAAF